MMRKGYQKSLALFLTFIMLLSIFNPFLVWAAGDEFQLDLTSEGNEETVTDFIINDDELPSDDDELQFDLTNEGNKESVTDFKNNDDDLFSDEENELDNILLNSQELQSENMLSIETSLTDMTTKAEIIVFDLWVKDSDGQKIEASNVEVTNNGIPVDINWDDAEKTSYRLILEVGENHVTINVSFDGENYTREFTIIREEAEDGEVIGSITFTLEAFTIGLGYLIEPIQVDLRQGENAAQKLLEILDNNGYDYDYGGSVESGFYFSRLYDGNNTIYKTTPSISEVLQEQLDFFDENNFEPGELGEFHFTFGSGWMYVVNNVFPNVGFSDNYLLDGDVMRLQYTLAYGNDIGGAFPGMGENFFPTVNRDSLTKKIAEINSSEKKAEYLSNPAISQAYNDAMEIIVKVDVSQDELDEALNQLLDAMGQSSNTPDLDKTDLADALAEAATKIETDYTEESYAALKAALEMPETTQKEVDAKVLAINQAIAGLLAKQEKVDKQALQSALTEANENKASVVVSVDGNDVEPTQKWVTQVELTAYETAISAAQAVVDNEEATQEAVDLKVNELATATTNFNNAKKAGAKGTEQLTFKVGPASTTVSFYATLGYDSDGFDLYDESAPLTAVDEGVTGSGSSQYRVYKVNVPNNVETISFRGKDANGNELGGMTVDLVDAVDGVINLRQFEGWVSTKIDNNFLTKERAEYVVRDKDNKRATSGSTYTGTNGETRFRYLLFAGGNAELYTLFAIPVDETLTENYGTNFTTNPYAFSMGATTGTNSLALAQLHKYAFTAPADAKIQVFNQVRNFYALEIEKDSIIDNGDGTITHVYKLPRSNSNLTYRASKEGHITKAGWLPSLTANGSMTIEWNSNDPSPKTRENNVASAVAQYVEESVLLNINSQNYLQMEKGETFRLRNYRAAWQITNNITANIMIEPDFYYNVISGSDVVSITPVLQGNGNAKNNWLDITALREGTAIIEISYDAIHTTGGSFNGTFAATDPNRTGLFVIRVGSKGTANIDFGLTRTFKTSSFDNQKMDRSSTWDAEFDTVYFEGSTGSLKFSPTATVPITKVEVLNNPATNGNWTELTPKDGDYTATITPGNNIIRITAGDTVEYQVVRGAQVEVVITNETNPNGTINPGDKLTVFFKGLYMPMSKFSGIYNPAFGAPNHRISYENIPSEITLKSTVAGNQYNLRNKNGFTIETTELGKYTLGTGYIYHTMMGNNNPAGGHRLLTDQGVPANFNASQTYHVRSILPDITIKVGDVQEIDLEALESAITEANENKASVIVSINGEDVEPTQKWVTQVELTTYETAIAAAQQVYDNSNATQNEVDNAVSALASATQVFNAAKKDGVKAEALDLEALKTAITEANENKASVVVSVDGKDVEPTQKWVTQEELTAFETAIAAAEQVYENSNATQNEVENAVSALASATQVFNAAKKDGVKAEGPLTVKEQLNRNLAYLVNTVDNPTLGTLGGEWSILSLARGEYAVPEGYYDLYYSNIEKEVEKLMPASGSKPAGRLDRNKGSEHSRLILGLTSIGKDITNVTGYDLRTALADFDYVTRQGINGPIFGLIAFDSYNYEIPVDSNVTNQTTREKMIQYILDKEIAGGGWALSGSNPDPDITAMAIQSLTPYYQNNALVKASVDRAITWLSNAQKADGGYSSWGTVNSESVAQVIVALTGLGIDPHTDSRFIKNGHSAVDNLMSYALPSGGFKHIKTGDADAMATDQGTYALVAYDRFVEGKTRLYDMTDVVKEVNKAILQSKINEAKANEDTVVVSVDGKDVDPTQKWVTQEEMTAYEIAIATAQQVYNNSKATQDEVDNAVSALVSATETFNTAKKKGEKSVPTIPLPEPNHDGVVRIVIDENNHEDQLIPNVSSNKDVKSVLVEIPESNQGRIMVDLPSNEALPRIEAVKGNLSVVLPQSVKITNGVGTALELLTSKDANDPSIINQVNTAIPAGKRLEGILQVVTMGGSDRVEFSDFVTLTFKGMKGKEAAYIQNGKLFPITKYNSDEEGLKSGKLDYAYESGNDLIVKTKHFTDFIVYTIGTDHTSGGGSGIGGPPLTRNTIILSIDKFTIGKGYVLPPTEVEFTPGESVWDVLQREMDKWGIPYTFVWTPKYNSVYVEWIAGDGEFDHGSGSGWMYNVNGWYPNYGASLYKLNNGDIVEWRYTTNLGADLGEDLSKWEIPGGIIPIIGGSIPAKEIVVDVNDKNPIINVPNNSDENYLITIPKKLRQTEKITINIPIENNNTWLNIEEVKDDIPLIEVRKGNKVLIFEKGTTLKTDQSIIQLFKQISDSDEQLTGMIDSHLVDEKASIIDAFEMGDSSSSTIFSQPVTLRLEDVKGHHVGVIDHKGNWNPIKIYESETKAREATKGLDQTVNAFVEGDDLIIKTSHFSTFVLYVTETIAKDTNDTKVVVNRPLKDVYTDADQISPWAYDVIQEATELRFVEGYNGKIYPKNEITRAEFIRLMVGILDMDLESGNASVFPDVKEDDWFYLHVNTAYSNGLIAGYDDGHFHPNKTITREEMAVIIERVLDLDQNSSDVVYQDHDQISEWAQNSVNSVSAHGIMVGYDDMFHPKDFVTREMAIAVAMRVYHFNNNQ